MADRSVRASTGPETQSGLSTEPETLVGLLERAGAAGDRAETTGLHFLDRRERSRFLSWRAIHARAVRTASRLVRLGVAPGDRVALVHPTGEEFFDAFFGTLLAGAVPVPLYPPVRLGRLDEYHRRTAAMLAAVGARLVLADRRVRRLLGPAVSGRRSAPELGCPTLDGLPDAGPAPDGPDRDWDRGWDRVRGWDGDWDRDGGPEDLALIQFSSGTTVDPKPVGLSHRAVLAQTRLLNGFWPEGPEGPEGPEEGPQGPEGPDSPDGTRHSGLSWLPLYHDMGLIGCVFPALERVADLTLIGPEVFVARPAIWLRALSSTRATISPAPNFAYALCVRKVRDEDLDGVDLSSWRIALDGAEAVSAETLRAFTDRFAPYGFRPEALTPVYGLSEASLAVTFSPLDEGFESRCYRRDSLAPGRVPQPAEPAREGSSHRSGSGVRELVSVGMPLPGFELEIRPPDGVSAPAAGDGPGPVGRVWVRGPSLMDGYFGRPDATARALVDGWLDTGDLGFLDRGRLYLTGRAKDLVIVRGRNVAPEEIERLAAAVPGARPGCAVAVSFLPEDGEPPAARSARPDRPDRAGQAGEVGVGSELLAVFVERSRARSGRTGSAAGSPDDEELAGAVAEAVLAGIGLACDGVEVLEPGTLPRTSSGKLRRGETLRRWRAGTLVPPRRMGPLRLASALVRSGLALAGVRPGSGPDPERDPEPDPEPDPGPDLRPDPRGSRAEDPPGDGA